MSNRLYRFTVKHEHEIHIGILITWVTCLVLLLTLPGCAVVDLVAMCSETPEACTSGGNTEYIRIDGKTHTIERTGL